ncbi:MULTISPECIES: tripartite tricarboxylate transporter substrate binding protein [unclassified Mesorhizobium]|uniref:Bug family tripartite tricarboxylate transporter substrate binding protein n=1 Tax=unclassified Mesorhizobium TaxID=325217 RepID=UPI00112D37BC|nr:MULTISPECIES: tripartite tricarboxylate transporter substrate binding protein [unclassified Mesorhizobium]MBZ9894364.1 tripartite tricarboxylate transporter substrate binding protein [Mesorhizobium sp. BR1-1-6]TPM57677.1 tripartite tricarboxylate transporter substrate binding protein [Mesorhizobium sp. B2-2-4]TPM65520.1 tripartite tricarboxylate transporter substrate binding protein [Mesorhizobium sp. B2-2-1]TPM98495.1 tripartite tricarboxylate transporter substrate binding protein [Mesorhiz
MSTVQQSSAMDGIGDIRLDRRGFMGAVAGTVGLGFSGTSVFAADTFPNKPITCLVPWGVGGGASTIADVVSKIGMEQKFSPVPITLDHRPGASGLIGTALVADRKGDSYTYMPGGGALLAQVVVKDTPVDPLKDLTPLALNAVDSSVVMTRTAAPYKTMADVIKKLQSSPRSVTLAGAGGGPGSWDGMLETVMNNLAGVQFNQIPFGGGGDVQAAVLGGQVDVGTRQLSDAQDLLKAGQVRALAIFDAERNPSLPDVPTMRELGFDVVLNLSRGWFAPPGLKQEEVAWYADFFKKVGASKAWQDFCTSSGIQNKYLGPEDWAKFIKDGLDTVGSIYRKIGVVK